MKTKFKVVLSLVIIVVLSFTNVLVIGASSKKNEVFTHRGLSFKVTRDAAEGQLGEVVLVKQLNKKAINSVVIPSKVTHGKKQYKVTVIGHSAFKNSKVKKLSIPNTVTKIESQAFMGCVNLKELLISKNVNVVGNNAFKGCNDLILSIPKYTTYEKSLIDNKIKYQYSRESALLIEQLKSSAPEDGVIYYRVMNDSETTYSYFNVECLLLDDLGEQIGGDNTNLRLLFKPKDTIILGVQTQDKKYSDIKILVTGNVLNSSYRDMSSFVDVVLHDDPKVNYDHFLEVASMAPKRIDEINVELVFYKDRKVVYIANCSFSSVYKGTSKQLFYLPVDIDYNSYSMNVMALSIK